MPHIPALEALYRKGLKIRKGELLMLAGRSGTGKSAFALWLVAMWNLPTLYCSADMSSYQASTRLACMRTGRTAAEVEIGMKNGQRQAILDSLKDLNITFSFASPITWKGIGEEMDAYVELHDKWPSVICLDNLLDFQGCEADYAAQMAVMQDLSALSRMTGATIIVLHHATDKSLDARNNPFAPPNRSEIKNGLSEKSECTLSVGLNPHTGQFNVAIIKQRSGPSDPSAQSYATLQSFPDKNQFAPFRVDPGLVKYPPLRGLPT